MAFDGLKNFINGTDLEEPKKTSNNEFYKENKTNSSKDSKMILLEPRAFSEAQTIAEYLKGRNTVVVNMKRVTPEVAKRIIDFLSGAIYAIQGNLQKLGNGIFLCTPNNVDIEGKMTDGEKVKKEKEDESAFNW